jgi:DNA replication protein DnaC
MSAYNQTIRLLTELKLNGMINCLDKTMNDAETEKHSYSIMLKRLLEEEVNYRNDKKLKRNLSGAHFPIIKKLEEFDSSRVNGITKTDLANLSDMRWIENKENILFFGPPGIGKTHLAIAFGYKAIEAGYKVCFEKVVNLMRLLKTSEIQRNAGFRINRITIIDEVGYTPIDRKEANLFFNLISELYEKTSIILTSNKSFESWTEMMGDEIMTVALLDRLLHHAKVFNINGDSYRVKNHERS